MSINEASQMSPQLTFADLPSVISSPASEAGRRLSDWWVGRQPSPSGLDPAHASPSAPPENKKGPPTSGTSGPSSSGSSASAALQSSLENRLRANLDVTGSPEFVLVWKPWTMLSGHPICALRARARLTSDSAFTGWPTPTVSIHGSPETPEARKARGFHPGVTIMDVLGGWSTPCARDYFPPHTAEYIAEKKALGHGMSNLSDQVMLAGWVTPSARDWKDTPGMSTVGINPDGSSRTRQDQLPRQAAMSIGEPSTSSTSPMEKRGALNPALCRWLMGFPPAWDESAVTAMPSSRKSRPSSSDPTLKH